SCCGETSSSYLFADGVSSTPAAIPYHRRDRPGTTAPADQGPPRMILEVQHETRFEYSEPVTEAVTEARMEPVSDADQSCRSFHLGVRPPAELFRYQDGFDNRVHTFNVLAPHKEVCILAASVVETHPRLRDLSSSLTTFPLALEGAELEVLDF